VPVRGTAAPTKSPVVESPLKVDMAFAASWVIPSDGSGAKRMVQLELTNSGPRTCDDVVIELRVPNGLSLFEPGGTKKRGHATIERRMVNPGVTIDLGYVAEDYGYDFKITLGGPRDVVQWSVTARDTPPSSGEIDVKGLRD
jgi:hypothetical protein